MFKSVATSRRVAALGAAITIAMLPARAAGQSAAEHVALGDREHAAMNAPGALKHYEAAIAAEPRNYEALWKAAREAVDVSEYDPSQEEKERLYAEAELYARHAVEANPSDAEGHFHLARALGRKALTLGKRDQVRYAGDVRAHALEALRLDPRHAGAEHVMGMWNYNVMRLSGIARFMAKNFLGGRVFDSANWDDAQRYMEESVRNDPSRLVHRLDLARVYVARGDRERARAQYEATIRATPTEYNDRHYQAEASEELKELPAGN
ncbi:MAG: tetratricopeptide repeat protein [Gemmatimonadaceae bacterium]